MAVTTPSEIATAAGAVPPGVTTRVLRMTRSAGVGLAMAGRRYVARRGCRQSGAASVFRCGNLLTCRRNTRPLPESPVFSDSTVLHTGRAKAMPQNAAPRRMFAPLFDVVVWHWSCESSHVEGSHFSRHREGAVSEGRKRIIRIVVAALGLTALLALQPESDRLVESAWARSGGRTARAPIVRRLILSDQARRYLALQYRSYPTEFMGCMIGEARGSAVLVRRIAPADVEPSHSTATRVVPHQTCEDAGWSGTVGVLHSHPGGERCWYHLPTAQVASRA